MTTDLTSFKSNEDGNDEDTGDYEEVKVLMKFKVNFRIQRIIIMIIVVENYKKVISGVKKLNYDCIENEIDHYYLDENWYSSIWVF